MHSIKNESWKYNGKCLFNQKQLVIKYFPCQIPKLPRCISSHKEKFLLLFWTKVHINVIAAICECVHVYSHSIATYSMETCFHLSAIFVFKWISIMAALRVYTDTDVCIMYEYMHTLREMKRGRESRMKMHIMLWMRTKQWEYA